MKIQGPYTNMICKIGSTLVEFKNFIAEVPDHIAWELTKHPNYQIVSEKKDTISLEEKEKMYYEFNSLLGKIKKNRKSDKLLITSSLGEMHKKLSIVTIPTMQDYCNRHNIDFSHIQIQDPHLTPYWQRYRFAELLSTYERIAYFDDDILIRPTALNLFDIVPYDCVGIYREGQYKTTFMDRPTYCKWLFKTYLEDILKRPHDSNKYIAENYYNNGIIVFSREHKYLFKLPDILDNIDWQNDPSTKGSLNKCGDQTNLNINIIDYNYRVFELKSPLVGVWDRCADYNYLDCQIIHFAWGGVDDKKILQIKDIRDKFNV